MICSYVLPAKQDVCFLFFCILFTSTDAESPAAWIAVCLSVTEHCRGFVRKGSFAPCCRHLTRTVPRNTRRFQTALPPYVSFSPPFRRTPGRPPRRHICHRQSTSHTLLPGITACDAQVDVYVEALCPYCRDFVVENLKTYYDTGLWQAMDIHMYYAGACRTSDGVSVWHRECGVGGNGRGQRFHSHMSTWRSRVLPQQSHWLRHLQIRQVRRLVSFCLLHGKGCEKCS